MPNESMLDVVSAAIDGGDTVSATTDTSTKSVTEGNSNADNDAASVAGSVGGDDGANGEETGTEGASDGKSADGEGGAEAGGQGSEGAGKPKAGAAPKTDPEKPTGEAAKTPAEPKVEPVKKTPAEVRAAAVNDPIDQRLKESTRDRIQLLANEVKRQDKQIADQDEIFGAIESTGMSPDELAMMLGYARARHHGTPEQKQQAYAFLKEELRAIALELGHAEDVDFLSEHQDLRDAVANNTITEEYAREIALARSRNKQATEVAAATNAQTQAQREHAAGVNALSQVGAALAKRDGEAAFLAKKDILVATLRPIFAQLPPAQWAKTFQQAYDALPKPAAPIAPASPPMPPMPPKAPQQPLRPATPAGGGIKKPTSMQEAVFAALDGTGE